MASLQTGTSTAVSRLPLQVFQANNDATEVVLNKLHTPLLTRFVRVRPQTWHSGIALRRPSKAGELMVPWALLPLPARCP